MSLGSPASGPITWGSLIEEASSRLDDEHEARILAEEVSGLTAAELVLAAGDEVGALAMPRFAAMLARRLAGEPLQHVVGHWGFRLLDLVVGPGALVPRPETEVVVEVALAELARLGGRLVVDLGTGTGAIAISLAVEAPGCHVYATDRSQEALRLASANLVGAGRLAAGRVTLAAGDWFEALPPSLAGRVDLVVSNPPYVSEDEWAELEPQVRLYDPRPALVAGPSGLEDVEKIVAGASRWLAPTGALVVEIAPRQAEEACRVTRRAGFAQAQVLPDLVGRARVLVGRR